MKQNHSTLTKRLHQNWWNDAVLGFGAVIAVLSSLYFLAFPNSGYQGGRNPYYDLTVIFSRHTWDIIHTWSGVAMILVALLHIFIHWGWITSTISRSWRVIIGQREGFRSRLTYNILIDTLVGLSFVICALSGVYFLFFASSGPTGDTLIFNKTTWDLIHTWSGVAMTISAILHFTLHWKWVVNITGKIFAKRQRIVDQKQIRSPVEQA